MVGDSLLSDGNKYPDKLYAWMVANKYSNHIIDNNANSGTHSWFGLVQLYGTSAGSDADIRDTKYNIVCLSLYQVNDWTDYHNECFEAIIRVLLTADPTKRIIVVLMPKCDAGITTVLPMEAWQQAEVDMCANYPNIIFHDFRQHCIDNPSMLNTWVADTLHLAEAGHTELVNNIIVPDWQSNPSRYIDDRSTPLPERVFDCEKYEYSPTVLRGNQCTSKSGTGWTTVNTTGWQSSTVGDEIVFDFTGVSFGVYYTIGATIAVSVDGGAYQNKNTIDVNGIPLSELGVSMARAAHQVKLKVVSGTLSVTQFWAI